MAWQDHGPICDVYTNMCRDSGEEVIMGGMGGGMGGMGGGMGGGQGGMGGMGGM